MIVADHPRYLPAVFRLFPDHDVLERAAILLAVLLVAKTVQARFHGAVIADRVHFEAARNELAPHSRGLVGGKQLFETFPRTGMIGETALVVVELQVVRKACHQPVYIVRIERREQDAVLLPDLVVERLRNGKVRFRSGRIRCRDRRRISPDGTRKKRKQQACKGKESFHVQMYCLNDCCSSVGEFVPNNGRVLSISRSCAKFRNDQTANR